MNSNTRMALEECLEGPWFLRVGKHDMPDVEVLGSWPEAIRHCSSPEWEHISRRTMARYQQLVMERSMDRYAKWLEVASEVRAVTRPFVSMKIEKVVRDHNLPQSFSTNVQWDILCLCMEAEYADVFPTSFYTAKGHYYANGHFPCGWQGDFPMGKFIIY
jgi:hypothetical protein